MGTATVTANYQHNLILALEAFIPDYLFIFAGQNNPEPEVPFCLITLINETPIGRPQKSHRTKIVDELTEQSYQLIQQDYEVNFTLTFRGLNFGASEQAARYLSIGLESDNLAYLLAQNGFGLLSYNSFPRAVININNTVNYVNDTIDITLLTNRSEEFAIEHFNSAEITGKLNYNEFTWNTDSQGTWDSGTPIESVLEIKVNV